MSAMVRLVEHLHPTIAALAVLFAMLAGWGIGWQRGRRAKPDLVEDPGIRFTDASLALLGLLLAFTFSLSLSRHDQRRAAVIAESNAIGDFNTCASLLKEPHRSRLQGLIKDYTQFKLDAVRHLASEEDLQQKLESMSKMQNRMTAIVAEAVKDAGPIAIPLTDTLNNVTSTQASRLFAYRERLPWSIVLLLLVAAVVPSFLMGLQQAKSSTPHLSGTVCFLLSVTFVIFVIFDLNDPGQGTIRTSQEPFERLLKSMKN
jgi:hypothetical protein